MIRQTIFLVLLMAISLHGYTQIKFEKGYFIDNTGIKTECFIKNVDWKNNPKEFVYKTDLESDASIKKIQAIQEFGVIGQSRYKRFEVSIDKSSNRIDKLDTNREPLYKKETLFLKLLVEGEAVLYEYIDNDLKRFFYSIKGSDVQQLVYKRYYYGGKIATNYQFRQQLWSDVRCKDISMAMVENISYAAKDLKRYFIKYNRCMDPDFNVMLKEKEQRKAFHLSIRPGINQSFMTLDNNRVSNFAETIDFGNELTFRIGIELEYILPFNKNKWSIFIEPTYQSYKIDEREFEFVPSSFLYETVMASVDYASIELPLGIRHRFFVGDQSNIFVNGALVSDIPLSSTANVKTDIPRGDVFNIVDTEIKASISLALGIGYKYKNKYGIELRYQTDRDPISDDVNSKSTYQTTSVIFEYTIF